MAAQKKLDWTHGPLAEGLRCYRNEDFFEAHEHGEGVWHQSDEPEKAFLQTLIQIAAALHHLERKTPAGTSSLRRLRDIFVRFGMKSERGWIE